MKFLPPELKKAISMATTLINFVKRSSLNVRLLRLICEEAECRFKNLLFYRGKFFLRSLFSSSNDNFRF